MVRQVPGSEQLNAAYQPASSPADAMDRTQAPQSNPSAAGEPNEQQREPVDYEAMIRQERQAREAAEAERGRLQQTLGQVEQGFQRIQQQNQQQADRQAFEQRRQSILQRADTMRADEANRFIASEMDSLYDEFQNKTSQLQQSMEQRQMQVLRQVATPLYIDDLIKRNNLPPEAREDLMRFGDPDVAANAVPFIKRQYDERKQLEERLEQLARSQQATQTAQSGVGRLGGYNGAPGAATDIPEGLSADERALWVYRNLRQAR
jgi:hypothetical protein